MSDRDQPGEPKLPRGTKGSRLVPPGYGVGYAKPPEASRFRKGVSGNPKGRPRGSKSKLPTFGDERMKQIILEEAYRPITVRDGDRSVSVPIVQAVMRSLAINAVKGQNRAQRFLAELVVGVEKSQKAHHDDWLQTAIEYKIGWGNELERRRKFGITNLPDPTPHPDQILVDLHANTARVVGPVTPEEKAHWHEVVALKASCEDDLRGWQDDLQAETDPDQRVIMEQQIEVYRKVILRLERALSQDGE